MISYFFKFKNKISAFLFIFSRANPKTKKSNQKIKRFSPSQCDNLDIKNKLENDDDQY